MIYFGSLFDIGEAIQHAFRILCGSIAALIYNGIVWSYNLFTYISRAEILDNTLVNEIYKKIGLLLSLFMVFKLTLSLIQSLIDPNKINDKKNGFGQIIMRSVTAIVLLGITPTLFKEAYNIQNLIIGSKNSDNIIYKLIVGKAPSNAADSFGKILASEVYFSFYCDDNYPKMDSGIINLDDGYADFSQAGIDSIREHIENSNDGFGYAIDPLGLREGHTYIIEFDGIFCIIVGAIVMWMLIMYCIQAAVRVFQLAYLQLIAPIPILSYVSDPDGAFKKWISQCTTTFLDLFIRLAIIYFVVSLLDEIITQMNTAGSVLKSSIGISDNNATMNMIKIFLILGLLIFAKRVPELLKDLFPNMGGGAASLSMGLKPPKEATSLASLGLGAAVGGVAGLATGIKHGEGIKGKIAGAFGGLGRGVTSAKTKANIFKNAQAGMNNTRAARQRAYEKSHDGSSFWGRNFAASGAARTKDEFDRQIAANDAYVNTMKLIEAETDKDARVISATNNLNSISSRGRATQAITVNGRTYRAGDRIATSDINDAITLAQKNVKKQRIACVEDVYNGTSTNGALTSLVNSAGMQVTKNSEKGYDGFGNVKITSGTGKVDYSSTSTASATDKAEGLFAYKSTAAADTGDIKNTGGSKNEAYKRAEANAKYDKKGK